MSSQQPNSVDAEVDLILAGQDPLREALERIAVCCDNGSEPHHKLGFIRRVAAAALTGKQQR
jgi:hypothetical protein